MSGVALFPPAVLRVTGGDPFAFTAALAVPAVPPAVLAMPRVVPLAVLAVAVLLAGLVAGPPATRRSGLVAGHSSPRRRGLAIDSRAGVVTGPATGSPAVGRAGPAEGQRAGRLPGLADGPHSGPAEGASAVRRGRLRHFAAAAALLSVVAVTVAPGLAVVPPGLTAVGLLAVRAARRRAAARRLAARAAAAPAVLDLLGAGLLAGLNPHLSVLRVAERAPGALREELTEAAAVPRLGATPAAALRTAAERVGLDELRAAAAALEVAERWGAPPAEALAARAAALRTRARLRAEAEAGRAAVRLAFPLVLCFLPAFVLLTVVPTVAGALRSLTP
jgi:tight adherence protein C